MEIHPAGAAWRQSVRLRPQPCVATGSGIPTTQRKRTLCCLPAGGHVRRHAEVVRQLVTFAEVAD